MDAPKGMSESFAILKHCSPNGIPMIVQQSSAPFTAADNANGMPLIRSHMILTSKDTAPPPYSISFPNGKKASDANLKHCAPIGIPTIVKHHKTPEIAQLSPCHIPPHKNHIIFPKHPIMFLRSVVYVVFSIMNRSIIAYYDENCNRRGNKFQ